MARKPWQLPSRLCRWRSMNTKQVLSMPFGCLPPRAPFGTPEPTRPQLDLKLRVAIILVTFAALGRDDEIRRYIPYAVHLGWTPQEIGEIFLHTLPYIGAPAALGALRVAVKELNERGLA